MVQVNGLEQLWRREAPRIRATLAHRLGDLDLAEEALSEAITRAMEVWPVEGMPPQPAGWLVTTAWHRALDRLRRERVGEGKLALLGAEPPYETSEDDRLALIFACCHPALDEPTQIALTLNAACGLTTEEIAAAFLLPAPTLAQRIVRAKRRLREAGETFTLPEPEQYGPRLSAALSVIYLVFNEGYLASSRTTPQRRELAREAMELARELASLMPGEPEAAGLAALIELQEARATTRFDGWGRLVLLADQDRSRWDRKLIESASARLDRALRLRRPGQYQTQAAIAALHASAESTEATDWPQIYALYTILHSQTGNPLALLNRAVTLRYRDGAAVALAEVDKLADRLGSYRLFHATRGELLQATGKSPEAREAYQRAKALATNPAERDLLSRRIEQT